MKNWKKVFVLLAMAMVLALVGCGSPADKGAQPGSDASGSGTPAASDADKTPSTAAVKEIAVSQDTEPESLDPSVSVTTPTYRLVLMSGEALLRNDGMEEAPGGAESHEVNDDHTEYVFHLRKESCFNDGTPITAADYVYALRHLTDPDNAFQAAMFAYVIKNAREFNSGECDFSEVGIEAVDDYTLKITTLVPTYPAFFSQVYFIPLSEAAVESLGTAYGAESEGLLTNGPYNIVSWVHDSEVILEKNPSYWNADAVNFTKIVCKIGATGDTAVDMMLSGELDAALLDNDNQIASLDGEGFSRSVMMTGRNYLHVNYGGLTPETGLFLSNTNFRKALSYAIDREALCNTVFDAATPANRMVFPEEEGVNGLFQSDRIIGMKQDTNGFNVVFADLAA